MCLQCLCIMACRLPVLQAPSSCENQAVATHRVPRLRNGKTVIRYRTLYLPTSQVCQLGSCLPAELCADGRLLVPFSCFVPLTQMRPDLITAAVAQKPKWISQGIACCLKVWPPACAAVRTRAAPADERFWIALAVSGWHPRMV